MSAGEKSMNDAELRPDIVSEWMTWRPGCETTAHLALHD